jgi:hypothetical protein
MVESWIIGLLAVLVGTPVAIASYVSAVRSARAERSPARPLRPARDGRAERRAAGGGDGRAAA